MKTNELEWGQSNNYLYLFFFNFLFHYFSVNLKGHGGEENYTKVINFLVTASKRWRGSVKQKNVRGSSIIHLHAYIYSRLGSRIKNRVARDSAVFDYLRGEGVDRAYLGMVPRRGELEETNLSGSLTSSLASVRPPRTRYRQRSADFWKTGDVVHYLGYRIMWVKTRAASPNERNKFVLHTKTQLDLRDDKSFLRTRIMDTSRAALEKVTLSQLWRAQENNSTNFVFISIL